MLINEVSLCLSSSDIVVSWCNIIVDWSTHIIMCLSQELMIIMDWLCNMSCVMSSLSHCIVSIDQDWLTN